MEVLNFSALKKGDVIFTLEQDRRSGYPIFDQATVLKMGESKPRPTSKDGTYETMVELILQDSVGQMSIFLPTNNSEGIYNNTYFTTDITNIDNELKVQQERAQMVLDNREKYAAIVGECKNIRASISSAFAQSSNGANINTQLSNEEVQWKQDVTSILKAQQSAIGVIMDALGLKKQEETPKEDGQ